MRPVKRKNVRLTRQQQGSLDRHRQMIAREMPELISRDQMRKEASTEPTLSGELRRAIHASGSSLKALAERVGVSPVVLDEFLTGERTLRSDVLDRLVQRLGLELAPRA